MARKVYVAPALVDRGSAVVATLGPFGGSLEAINQKATVG